MTVEQHGMFKLKDGGEKTESRRIFVRTSVHERRSPRRRNISDHAFNVREIVSRFGVQIKLLTVDMRFGSRQPRTFF